MNRRMVNGIIALFLFSWVSAHAQFGIGADVVSRYIWRGSDFGNTAAVQPYLSYSNGPVEIGAWSSWSINPAPGGYENDLYLTLSAGQFSLTVTDYYFPKIDDGQDDFFKFGDNAGIHFLEATAAVEQGAFSAFGGLFFSGDDENSAYLEGSYQAFSGDDVSASIFLAGGNGIYSLDADFSLVNLGLTVSKGIFSASYILNPNREITFLVFGASFR